MAHGWVPSSIDPCLYSKVEILLGVYVNSACLLSPRQDLIKCEIATLKQEFHLTDEGEPKDYLGTRFNRRAMVVLP